MESTKDIKRIHTINDYLRDYFGYKVIKLSLDGGFTCPNRDGTKGQGGCAFCSSLGSGEMASPISSESDIEKSIAEQIELLSTKWPNASGYIAYFQNHTNTYAPTEILKKLFYKALKNDKIIGLAIATRPDCISDKTLELLSQLNRETFLWVELGLQTYDDTTAQSLNRCYKTAEYEISVSKLLEKGIRIVTHIILGLPGEDERTILKTIDEVCKPYSGKHIFGIKLHLLNLVKGSALSKSTPEYVSFSSIEQYTDLVVKILTRIPWEITVHRLTADVPRKLLISPSWSYKKRTILNEISKKMKKQKIIQGKQ